MWNVFVLSSLDKLLIYLTFHFECVIFLFQPLTDLINLSSHHHIITLSHQHIITSIMHQS